MATEQHPTFSPHPDEHPEWTGHDDIFERGYDLQAVA